MAILSNRFRTFSIRWKKFRRLFVWIKVPYVIVRLNPSRPCLPNETMRIPGTTWAEEMDLHDPPENSENEQQDGTEIQSARLNKPQVSRWVVEVSQRTGEHLAQSFSCMSNPEWQHLAEAFLLPKMAVMKTPSFNKVMLEEHQIKWPGPGAGTEFGCPHPTNRATGTGKQERCHGDHCRPNGACSGICNYPPR